MDETKLIALFTPILPIMSESEVGRITFARSWMDHNHQPLDLWPDDIREKITTDDVRRLVDLEAAAAQPAQPLAIAQALTLLALLLRFPARQITSPDPAEQMLLDLARNLEIEDLQSLPADLFLVAWRRLRQSWKHGYAPRVADFREQVGDELADRQKRLARYKDVLTRMEGGRVRGGGLRRLR
jgi:hypothetical protein